MALPYLSEEMEIAAEQMEFIEVWIASAIIMEICFLLLMFLTKKYFKD